MTKFILLALLIVLRITYQPTYAQSDISSFEKLSPAKFSYITDPKKKTNQENSFLPVKIISLEGNIQNNKVMLTWVVDENETAYQFEVEKSSDGKIFQMAALVFSTDKPATDTYQFYEKPSSKIVYYRIKMINNKKESSYSSVITINPNI
jgi:hypothetical protein